MSDIEPIIVNAKCFLCHKKNIDQEIFKLLDAEVCPSSQKTIRAVLEFIISYLIDNCESKIDLKIPRNKHICQECYENILDYDTTFVSLLKKQRRLARLVERALLDVDSDYERDLYDDLENEPEVSINDMVMNHQAADVSPDSEGMQSMRECSPLLSEKSINIEAEFSENSPKYRKRLKKTVNADGKKEFVCLECNLTFLKHCDYRRHYRKTHFAGYVCDECGKVIKDYTGFKVHIQNHNPVKQFPCPTCGKFFANKRTLKHHTAWHSGEQNFECDICRRKFVHRVNLLKHRIIHDETTRKYPCNLCPLKFRSKAQIDRHTLTHTKAKPHSCHICGRSFAIVYNLRTHVKEHEQPGSTRRKHIKCQECGKGFTSKKNYEIHCKSHSCLALNKATI